jgi:tetratricopeptide (TPR) repeat protein
LQHAHEQGLVHRDIKPSNLILTRQGIIKILDLGLAQVTKEASPERRALTKTGVAMGTPDYLAPEQVLDAKNVDIRADLYSLGCSLYHLLTGQVPFPTVNVADKLIGQQYEQPRPVEELRPGLPAALVEVVRRLMAKKPEQRFRTPAQVVEALFPFTQASSEPDRPLTIQDRSSGHNAEEGTVQPTVQDSQRPAHSLPTQVDQPPRKRWVGRHRWTVGLMLGMLLILSGSIYLGTSAGSKPLDGRAKRARSLHQSGFKHYQAREYDKAIADFTEAVRYDPQCAEAYLHRGYSYRDKKEPDRAIPDFTEVIRLDPSSMIAYRHRAFAHHDKMDLDRAIQDYTNAVHLDPKQAESYTFRGIAYRDKKEPDLAIGDFTEAIRLNPNEALPYGHRGSLLRQRGDFNGAIADFTAALRLHHPDQNEIKKQLLAARHRIK